MSVEQRLIDLGLELPQPMRTDTLPFDLVRADGNHLYLSGHVPTDLTGKVSQPFGKVGADVNEDEAYRIAAFKNHITGAAATSMAPSPINKRQDKPANKSTNNPDAAISSAVPKSGCIKIRPKGTNIRAMPTVSGFVPGGKCRSLKYQAITIGKNTFMASEG